MNRREARAIVRGPRLELKRARYSEPEPAPVYDPREADSNALIADLDRIADDARRHPEHAHSLGEDLRKHERPRVLRASRERWPYSREVLRAYAKAIRVARAASRAPSRDRRRRR